MIKWLVDKKWSIISVLLAVVLLLVGLGIVPTAQIREGKKLVTIGGKSVDAAGGLLDFYFTGVNDNTKINSAIAALPASGGEVDIISPAVGQSTINFSGTVTVPANVTIHGAGTGTHIVYNSSTACFAATNSTSFFQNLWTDVGGISGTYTASNITIGTTYYATVGTGISAPTGRTASYTIAASNAPDYWKKQADAVCNGVTDQSILNAYAVAGHVILSPGDFYFTTVINPVANEWLSGQGDSTILHHNFGGAYNRFIDIPANGSGITLSDFAIDGMFGTYGYTQGFDIVTENATTASPINHLTIQNITVTNSQGIGIAVGIGGQTQSITNLIVTGCRVSNSQQANYAIGRTLGATITNNYGNTSGNTWSNYDGNSMYNTIFSNNTAISAVSHGFSLDGGNNVQYTNNTVLSPVGASFYFLDNGAVYTGFYDVQVKNNYMYNDTNGYIVYGGNTANLANFEKTGNHPGSETFSVLKTSNQSVTSNQTLQNDTTLAMPISAYQTWQLTFLLRLGDTGGDGLANFQYKITTPAGSDCTVESVNTLAGGTYATENTALNANVPITVKLVAADRKLLVVNAIVANGATAGIVQLQWAQNTSEPYATYVLGNSSLVATQLQ